MQNGEDTVMTEISEKTIVDFLDFQGIPHQWCGFQYLYSALMLVCNDATLRANRQCGSILSMVGEPMDKSSSTIDKGIRTALAKINCPMSVSSFLFWACDTMRTKPQNEWKRWDSQKIG